MDLRSYLDDQQGYARTGRADKLGLTAKCVAVGIDRIQNSHWTVHTQLESASASASWVTRRPDLVTREGNRSFRPSS